MDNPEELLHSLAEFVKLKPKEIPADLEQYLSYVAKTGDPIYQWPLVKALFREKLLNVITEFYETCPTAADAAPACPNVDFFNYETMKVGLVERLESFASAPFTVQRLCELLTAPRKQYSRADKFMRAVEKNMLVVSTREPGPQRVGQDVDMANGEEKPWLGRQPVPAAVDRAPGLELAAFRYEPFGSSPGTAFFPPLKQKLDDFLETDAAVSAIAPQAANLANLAAISPEQVASLAATIGPDVANLAVEIAPEVANLATEIPPEVADLAADIPPEVANLAAAIAPEVANLAAEIAPVVANLAGEIPPEADNLTAQIPSEVADLAAQIPLEVAKLAAQITPDVANLVAQIPPEVAGLAAELTPLMDAANSTANISHDNVVTVAASSANTRDEEPNVAANPTGPSGAVPVLPQEQQENVASEEKIDVTELAAPAEGSSTNHGEAEKEPANQEGVETKAANNGEADELKAANEPTTNCGEDEKMVVDDDESQPISTNQGHGETTTANQTQVEKAPANEGQAAEKTVETVMEKTAETFIEKAAETQKLVSVEGGGECPTNENPVETTATNEQEADKQQEDRRQVQSERVQSVIRETLDREDSGPPAKVPRMDDSES